MASFLSVVVAFCLSFLFIAFSLVDVSHLFRRSHTHSLASFIAFIDGDGDTDSDSDSESDSISDNVIKTIAATVTKPEWKEEIQLLKMRARNDKYDRNDKTGKRVRNENDNLRVCCTATLKKQVCPLSNTMCSDSVNLYSVTNYNSDADNDDDDDESVTGDKQQQQKCAFLPVLDYLLAYSSSSSSSSSSLSSLLRLLNGRVFVVLGDSQNRYLVESFCRRFHKRRAIREAFRAYKTKYNIKRDHSYNDDDDDDDDDNERKYIDAKFRIVRYPETENDHIWGLSSCTLTLPSSSSSFPSSSPSSSSSFTFLLVAFHLFGVVSPAYTTNTHYTTLLNRIPNMLHDECRQAGLSSSSSSSSSSCLPSLLVVQSCLWDIIGLRERQLALYQKLYFDESENNIRFKTTNTLYMKMDLKNLTTSVFWMNAQHTWIFYFHRFMRYFLPLTAIDNDNTIPVVYVNCPPAHRDQAFDNFPPMINRASKLYFDSIHANINIDSEALMTDLTDDEITSIVNSSRFDHQSNININPRFLVINSKSNQRTRSWSWSWSSFAKNTSLSPLSSSPPYPPSSPSPAAFSSFSASSRSGRLLVWYLDWSSSLSSHSFSDLLTDDVHYDWQAQHLLFDEIANIHILRATAAATDSEVAQKACKR